MGVIFQLMLSMVLFSCGGGQSGQKEGEPTGDAADGKLNIEMVIPNAPNDVLKMLAVVGNQNLLIDSAVGDANGRYLFKVDSLLPNGFFYVMLASDNSYFQLLLDKDQEFKLETRKGDLINSMKVEGCLDNELLYQNLKFEAAFNTRLQPVNDQLAKLQPGTPEHTQVKAQQDALVKERVDHVKSFSTNHPTSFFTKFKLAGQNPELTYPKLPNGEIDQVAQLHHYRMAFWDHVDFSDPATLRTPVYVNKLRRFIKELTPSAPDSLIKYATWISERSKAEKELFKFTVNWIAIEYKTPKTLGSEALYVHMIDTYWTEELAFWSNPDELKGLRHEVDLMRPSLLGKTGQDIQAKNERGESVSLHGLRSPIKVLFIYSYDCEHCQKEAPEMARVYNQLKSTGVEVFALCTDTDRTKWTDFVRKNNMNFTNAFDPERSSRYDRKYHIDITPELYVLDRNNRIIASNLSPAQLPEFLQTERAKNPW